MAAGIDDLAMNLVGSALLETVRRPVHVLRSLHNRQQEIAHSIEDRQISKTIRDEKRVEGAFNDLKRVLGNKYGEYTQHVDRFLLEVRSSRIPTAVHDLIICGKSPDPVFPAFKTLYETFAPLPFECEPLFRAFTTAVKSRIDYSVADPAMLDAVRAHAESIRDEISVIGASLARSKRTEPLQADQFLESRVRIARSIESVNRDLPVETERGTRRIAISRIVIPARLQPAKRESLARDSRRHEDASVGLTDFRRSLRRAVIVGDPGGGKSTLTQLLCFEMAKRLTVDPLKSAKTPDERDLRLPLRVVIRTLDNRQRGTAGYTILDYLRDELRPALDNDGKLTQRFLVQVLTTGKAVLLFDGLDEILEVGRRRQMSSYIEQFVDTYAACQALVTSRAVGYSDAPLSGDFDVFILSRLNREEITKFAEKLIRAIGGKNRDPKTGAVTFIKQTESNAADLRQNPLLLGLMVYIFTEKGDVPDNRPEIYRACSQLLFLKWDQRRDILFDYPDDFELLDLFGCLAVQIFGDPEAEEGVSEGWLFDKVRAFFFDWYSDRAKAAAAARALVKFITGRAWVMCDVGPGVYKFTHRTFLEYFVARRLESESESVAALLQTLYPKVVNAEWDVVSHLALQIAASSGPKAARAIDGLLALMRASVRTPDEEFNFIVFSARALEYLPVPDGLYISIVTALMDRATHVGATASVSSMAVFSELLRGAKKKSSLLTSLLHEHLARELRGTDWRRKRFSLFVIGARLESYGTGEAFVASGLAAKVSHLRSATLHIRDTFFEQLLEEAVRDPESARLFLIIYDKHYDILWQKHGAELLFYASDDLAPKVYNNFPYWLVESVIAPLTHGGTSDKSKQIVLERIAQLAPTDGIRIQIPIPRTETATDDAYESLSRIVRYAYHANRSFGRKSKSRAKVIQNVLVAALCLLEFEDVLGGIASSGREGGKRRYKQAQVIGRLMPADIFLDIARRIDRVVGNSILEDWAYGRVVFIRR